MTEIEKLKMRNILIDFLKVAKDMDSDEIKDMIKEIIYGDMNIPVNKKESTVAIFNEEISKIRNES